MSKDDTRYNKAVAKSYDADRESEEHWKLENAFVEEYFRSHTPNVILDVPIGTGRHLAYYPSSSRVVGVDISSHMLDQAMARATAAAQKNVELRLGDASSLRFLADKSVDAIVCCRLIHLVRPRLRLQIMREFARVLGGDMILQAYIRRSPPRRAETARRLVDISLRAIRLRLGPPANPWEHIESFPMWAHELNGLLADAGLTIRSKSILCQYGVDDVAMFILAPGT